MVLSDPSFNGFHWFHGLGLIANYRVDIAALLDFVLLQLARNHGEGMWVARVGSDRTRGHRIPHTPLLPHRDESNTHLSLRPFIDNSARLKYSISNLNPYFLLI